jgi:hypothetical protein
VFVAGVAVSVVVAQQTVTQPPEVHWELIEAPPGEPVHLRLGERGEVLVETADGRLFEWDRSEPQPWVEVEVASGHAPFWSICVPGPRESYSVTDPPGQAIDRVESTCGGAESSTHYQFALLENGEIWMWRSSYYAPGQIILAGAVLILGVGASLLLSVIVFAFMWWRARRAREP